MRLATGSIRKRCVAIALSAFAFLHCNRCSADSGSTSSTAIRLSACAPLQAGFDRVYAAHAQDPNLINVSHRLTVMDRATEDVLHELQLHRSSYLDQSLATVGGGNPQDADTPKPLTAATIVEKYQLAFAPLSLPTDLNIADRRVLASYLNAAENALSAYAQSRVRSCMSLIGADGTELSRLAFVLDVLASDPNQDLAVPAPPLPSWMNHGRQVHILETFATEAGRPRLAFALATRKAAASAADLSLAYLRFAEQQSGALARTAKFKAALSCLRDGVTIARLASNDTAAFDLSLRVADLLDVTESPEAAAQEIERVRLTARDPQDYARASLLHLKYLYQAGQYQALDADASADVQDPRCQGALPPIIYTAWFTCRRHGMDATPWSSAFLQQFPQDPLGAEMYFTSAMDALAQDDAQQATRLLQFIQYRFPESKVTDRVRQVLARLAVASAGPR